MSQTECAIGFLTFLSACSTLSSVLGNVVNLLAIGNCFLLSFVTKKVLEEAKFLPFFGLLDMLLFFRTKRFQAELFLFFFFFAFGVCSSLTGQMFR